MITLMARQKKQEEKITEENKTTTFHWTHLQMSFPNQLTAHGWIFIYLDGILLSSSAYIYQIDSIYYLGVKSSNK